MTELDHEDNPSGKSTVQPMWGLLLHVWPQRRLTGPGDLSAVFFLFG